MKKIEVKTKTESYPILTGHGILEKLPALIKREKLYENLFIVIDRNVERFHGRKIKKIFNDYRHKLVYYSLPDGENTKSYVEVNKIYTSLLKNEFGRDTTIIAIGGGVTGDLVGYAASTYMRGTKLIHVPTTLLAMVDSSIGGKTGINFGRKKNMVGSFYQPAFVLIDTSFLRTLPKKEVTSGIGEVIKYAFLSDKEFFSYVKRNRKRLENLNSKIVEEIILQSVSIKAGVVSADEKESGLRKILNLGHTFAHAYESAFKFEIKHGEAVAAGIISALYLSNQLSLINKNQLRDYLKLPLTTKPAKDFKMLDNQKLYKIMLSDKKSRDSNIKFVLVADIGNIVLDVEADKKEVFMALAKTKEILSC